MLLPAQERNFVSGETALFSDLVAVGEARSHTTLPISLRNFLVSCLVEHLSDPAIVHQVLALNFLESSHKTGASLVAILRRSGDASLILAGLFPERALRLNVSSAYFRMMGQSFYGSLAAYLESGSTFERGRFYNEVACGFEALERVLNGARGKAENEWMAFQRFRARLT